MRFAEGLEARREETWPEPIALATARSNVRWKKCCGEIRLTTNRLQIHIDSERLGCQNTDASLSA